MTQRFGGQIGSDIIFGPGRKAAAGTSDHRLDRCHPCVGGTRRAASVSPMIWNQLANEMLIFVPFATSRLERAPLFGRLMMNYTSNILLPILKKIFYIGFIHNN